ncbi:putative signal transduction histidine kinase [Sphingobium sp. ba1]|nr:putative signal transduction histidine kinase [Sphingobium sp. ba1]
MPIAFLLTELVELAMMLDPQGTMRISAHVLPEQANRALLSVVSSGLRASEDMTVHLSERYGRVLTGLSRQLRSALDHDGEAGSYAIAITIIP